MENSLDLTEESPSYSVVPTSLVNLDIVLPLSLFWEHEDSQKSHLAEIQNLGSTRWTVHGA